MNDDAGHTYTYDAENHIKSVDGVAAYVYDGEGQRVRKLIGENIRVVYGITGEMIAEYDGKRTTLQTSGARTIINLYAERETDKQKAVAVLMQSTLERVAAGRRVEMKLGEKEVTLDESVLKNVREFFKVLSR